jgi:hypothetical protein
MPEQSRPPAVHPYFSNNWIQVRGGTRSACWRNSAPQCADGVSRNHETLPRRPAPIAVSRASPHASPYRDCRLRADQPVDICRAVPAFLLAHLSPSPHPGGRRRIIPGSGRSRRVTVPRNRGVPALRLMAEAGVVPTHLRSQKQNKSRLAARPRPKLHLWAVK